MAANKRKQDEKHLKILREIVSLPHNKQCFDCHQRGPTYVNMTTGSFVCTSCSGLLRGLNPPQRVKSISMTSFTPEEIEFLKCHGNSFCKQVWLGLHDSRSFPEPDSKDDTKIREFMTQKYEKKRWYVAPTEGMKEEAKRQNELKQETKPLKSVLGNNVPQLVINNAQNRQNVSGSTSIPVPPPSNQPASRSVNPQPPPPVTARPTPEEKKPSGLDLLGDLGGDPFAAPAAPQANNAPSGGFADFTAFNGASSGGGGGGGFANFGDMNSVPQPMSSQPVQPAQPSFMPPAPTGLLNPAPSQPASSAAPNVGGFGDFSTANIASGTTSSTGGGSDKYAALADLDNVFGTAGGSSQAVNWDGGSNNTGGGNLSWNSTGTSINSSGGGNGGNWNSSATPSMSSATNASAQSMDQNWHGFHNSHAYTVTQTSVSKNPFKSTRRPVPNPFGTSTSNTAANPFASTGGGGGGGFAQFGQFGQTSNAPSSAGGFGQLAGSATTNTPSSMSGSGGGFGQFGTSLVSSTPPGGGSGFEQFGGMQSGMMAPGGAGFGQFGNAVPGAVPSTAAGGMAGFGQFPPAAPQGQVGGAAGFAQFGGAPQGGAMQNGGSLFGGGSQPRGWGSAVPSQQPAAASMGGGFSMMPGAGQPPQQQQAQMNAFSGGFPGGAGMNFGAAAGTQFPKKNDAAGFGMQQQTGGFAGWNQQQQQPAANPFMSSGQNQAVPPRGSSTNPFL